jgi:ribose transport system substrate-binding protein
MQSAGRMLLIMVMLFLVSGSLPVAARGAKEPPRAPSATPSETPADRQLTFVIVPKGVHPYFEPVYRGFQDGAAHYGIAAEVDAPPRFDVTLQVKVIEDLIARGVDGIAISANDDKGLVAVIHEAMQAGIKVITVDAPAPSSEALTYIGTDNASAGYLAGRRMAAAMKGAGSVAVLQGGLAATNLNLRTQGFRKGLAEAGPSISVTGIIDEGGDFSESVNKTEALLAAHPALSAIFSVSAEGAPAAAAVVKRRGLAGRVLIAGFDDLGDTLTGIHDGSISFCVVQNTYRMGWLSVEQLLAAVKGERIPDFFDTGVVFVDRANLDTYKALMEKEAAAKQQAAPVK